MMTLLDFANGYEKVLDMSEAIKGSKEYLEGKEVVSRIKNDWTKHNKVLDEKKEKKVLKMFQAFEKKFGKK